MQTSLLFLALVAAGCGSSSPGTSPADAADAASDASSVAVDGMASKCTQLGYAGARVTPIAAGGSAPAAQGGAIVDGTYRLTGYQVYNNAIDPMKVTTLHASIRFAGGTYETAFQTSQAEAKESGTVSTSGATLQFTRACPTQQTENVRRYSAVGARFDLYDVSGTSATDPTEVATYTRE